MITGGVIARRRINGDTKLQRNWKTKRCKYLKSFAAHNGTRCASPQGIMPRSASSLVRASFVLSLLALGVACTQAAPDEAPIEGEDDDLVGGTVASEGQFPSSLLVRAHCTSTKVGPKHILTAAHCVVGDGGSINWMYQAPFQVTTKVLVDQASPEFPWISVTPVKIHLPPSVEAAVAAKQSIYSWGEHADIAVIELDDASGEKLKDIPIAEIDTEPLAVDEAVTIQGYGCENGFAGTKDYSKARLKFQATKVASYETLAAEAAEPDSGVTTVYVTDQDRRQFFATRGQGRKKEEASLCPGDSGGPVYRGADGGRVVGVNSRGWKGSDANAIGTTNSHTRLDANTQWDVAGWLGTVPGVRFRGTPAASTHFEGCETVMGRNQEPFKVCGKILAAFKEKGAAAQLGLPTEAAGLEEHATLGLGWSQRFEYAVIRERPSAGGAIAAQVDKFASRCDGKKVGGFYCGSSLSDSNPKNLYQCTQGAVPVLTVCEFGCKSMPSGVPDKCGDKPKPDLCGQARKTGMYCARNFDSADQKRLLRCENGKTVRDVACSKGCKGMPSGVPDKCND